MGLGVGLASVTVPVYIAECAPPAVRATLVTVNVSVSAVFSRTECIFLYFFSHF